MSVKCSKPLGDSHYVISNGLSDSFVLCFMCLSWEGFLSSTHAVIMNFGHHIVNDKLIFSLIEFPLRLLVLFSNIMSLFLLSLYEYVNTIRMRIIIAFVMIVISFWWVLCSSPSWPPKDCNCHYNDYLNYN
jgi:hypothetical protein